MQSRLVRLAKAKADGGHGPLLLPELARAVGARHPITYTEHYFKRKVRAPFLSPDARDYQFVSEQRFSVDLRSRDRFELVSAISDRMSDFAYYLSNYLTHPRYGPEKQVGFVRGESLRPYDLREDEPGRFSFRIQGVAVGRRDMFNFLLGPNRDGPKTPYLRKPPHLSLRSFIVMPTKPDGPGVDDTEWYDFKPRSWKRKHPRIPLTGPIAVLLHRARPQPPLSPRYDEMYRDGVLKIALLFGYDEEEHLTSSDAHDIWEILTAPRKRRFTKKDTGEHGYRGPGLGFFDPTGGHWKRLDFDGKNAFVRDAGVGAGPVRVRFRQNGSLVKRHVRAEVRLYNFDKSSRGTTSDALIERFVSVFKDNDVVHYDGHANYGGGFFIGDQANDILWSCDIGKYKGSFSRDYQIFSIGACHAAAYFADLFFNELRPRKSPHNLDILAAVNETAFEDSVHQSMDFIRAMLQDVSSPDGPPDYDRILRDMSDRNSFAAFIGVFGSGVKSRPRRRATVK